MSASVPVTPVSMVVPAVRATPATPATAPTPPGEDGTVVVVRSSCFLSHDYDRCHSSIGYSMLHLCG